MTLPTHASKDTWALFMLGIAITVAIVGGIYIIPRLSAENWDTFVSVCHQDSGSINAANQCIIPLNDRVFISRSITGIETYCTLPTRACGLG